MFHCSVIKVPVVLFISDSFYIISKLFLFVKNFFYFFQSFFVLICCRFPRQLLYCIKTICICQQLFYFFKFLKMSTLNSTFFHVFIVLLFCTICSLFYCIFSLLGSAIVRLPLLPASHAPYFRSYASCFTSSSNSSPAE